MKFGKAHKVKEFWEERAGTQDISPGAVTHRDVWQRWLEIEMIKRWIKGSGRVLDIGCGNGYTTKRIAPLVEEILGIDYSEEMIARAVREDDPDESVGRRTATFEVGDVLALTPSTFGVFDAVISERCLINLSSSSEQQQAIATIASILKPGGLFVFIEGCKDGRAELNRVRKTVGLEEMPLVWHNIDFDEMATLEYLSSLFTIRHRLHFGLYDFVSRVVHPLTVAPESPKYDCRINEVAAKLALSCQEFGSISRTLFLVLERRPHA